MSRPDDHYPLPTPEEYRDAYRRLRLRPGAPDAEKIRQALTPAALMVLAEAARLAAVEASQDTPAKQAVRRAELVEASYTMRRVS